MFFLSSMLPCYHVTMLAVAGVRTPEVARSSSTTRTGGGSNQSSKIFQDAAKMLGVAKMMTWIFLEPAQHAVCFFVFQDGRGDT